MGVPILGGGGGPDNVGKIPTFYRFLFWRTSLTYLPSNVGRVEKSKNGFGSYGYYFLNGFWYIENGGNFFFGIREYLDKWNFT